jgi:hypothetical protein
MKRLSSAGLALCIMLAGGLAIAGEPVEDTQAFDRLKTLAGTWEAETPGGEGVIRYRVASAGSVVIEELFPGTDHEMMTVYHMDGSELVATHYCSAGNQPRFKLDPSTSTSDTLAFGFNGGSNMKPSDGHIHEGSVRMVDADHVEETWSFWKDGKPDHPATFKMKRKSSE